MPRSVCLEIPVYTSFNLIPTRFIYYHIWQGFPAILLIHRRLRFVTDLLSVMLIKVMLSRVIASNFTLCVLFYCCYMSCFLIHWLLPFMVSTCVLNVYNKNDRHLRIFFSRLLTTSTKNIETYECMHHTVINPVSLLKLPTISFIVIPLLLSTQK